MCGRFRRRSDKQKVAKTFEVTAGLEETDFESGDDFSPQSMQPVIYQNADGAPDRAHALGLQTTRQTPLQCPVRGH